MDRFDEAKGARRVGIALIVFAIAFNLPYAWLASNFDYPDILRSPPGVVLAAFADGGAPLVLAWAAFALAALLFAPIAVAVAAVTRRSEEPSSAVAALGIAAGVTQAIGLSRWVYAVPGLAASWVASAGDAGARASIETTFTTLHQFAGVGIGEAIGQSLTAFWLIGVAIGAAPASALRRRAGRRRADWRRRPAPRPRRRAGDRHSVRPRRVRPRRGGRLPRAHRLDDLDGHPLRLRPAAQATRPPARRFSRGRAGSRARRARSRG